MYYKLLLGIFASLTPSSICLGSNPIALQIGESAVVQVNSACKINRSNVILENGAHYTFTIQGSSCWSDGKIHCSANGWKADQEFGPLLSRVAKRLEPKRKCPLANWFELVGSNQSASCVSNFRIGCRGSGWTFTPRFTGKFSAFANDLESRYHNNSGTLCVVITRVATALRPLPACNCR